MKKIIDNLYVGTVVDYEIVGGDTAISRDFSILGACKEPLHRQHARLQGADCDGYTGRAMAADEPEYLWAEREHALYLNLIDAREEKYIPREAIEKALNFIYSEIMLGRDVLIVCNKAESRSPAIAFMFLMDLDFFGSQDSFEEIEASFKRTFYPEYSPGVGIRNFTKTYWREIQNGN